MAKGKINLQANDGSIIGLVVPDGLVSGEREVSLGSNLSGITAYHLLGGNLSIDNSTITQGFNTTLYTGNGTTQAVNTGIDMDTQWGNTADERFGGLVWMKSRSVAGNNYLFDTIRGATHRIVADSTVADAIGITMLTAFNNNGFSVGSDIAGNTNATTYAGWNFQTTHRVSGTTNHGKAYTCHYNPFTGFTMVKYVGSGLAGHEIPHHLGRKLGFYTCKQLDGTGSWMSQYRDWYFLYLNMANTETTASTVSVFNETNMSNGTTPETNGNNLTYIMYGWADSYFDESNKLIGNYELVTYQGTGVAGNKVKTKGKPAWVMIKRTDSTGSWNIFDNKRGSDFQNYLYVNSSIVEGSAANFIDALSDGFNVNLADNNLNVSGGQYIALVAYDTNSNGGGSYYPLATDTANVQINNALIPLAQGIDGSGSKNSIVVANETITGLAYTEGKNYLFVDKLGAYGVTPYRPRYLSSDLIRTFASEASEYYDVVKNKWFSTSGHGELVTNGTFDSNTTGWTACEVAGAVIGTISVSNSTLQLTNNGTASTYTGAYQILSGLTIGREYTVKSYGVSTCAIMVGTSPLYASKQAGANAGTTLKFIAHSTSVHLVVYNNTATASSSVNIDNISVFASDIVPTTEITNSRNYLNHIVYADADGGVLYVEELPKIEYKDVIKANDFKGKNACTAWVNFDGTTTPPTIRDSYGFSSCIRTGVARYRLYFDRPMDNLNYGFVTQYRRMTSWADSGSDGAKDLNYIAIQVLENGAELQSNDISVQIFGGRN